MLIKKNGVILLLILITILAFFLRFYKLDQIPPGPEWDEASVGYNAFSIAQTGKDEWGNKFPLIFPAFGDYKNPLYIYLTTPIVKIFGLNIITTRFVNALTGSLLILIWCGITYLLFKEKIIALLTSLFLAISPFGIFFSRIAGDGIMLSVFLIGLAILLELYFLQTKKAYIFIASTIILVLSMFSYNLGRIISPLLLGIIFCINFFQLKINKKIFILPIIVCLIGFYIIVQQSKISLSSRLKYVSIFGTDKGVVLQINEYRHHDKNNLISKLLHNKLTFFLITISSSYLSHFSSNFLVNMKTDIPVSESHYPPLQFIMLPFYYIGIFLTIKYLFYKTNLNRAYLLIILTLFFIATFPSMITEGAPSSKRNLAQLGLYELFVSVGLFHIWTVLKGLKNEYKKFLFSISIIILFIISISYYLYFFFFLYPKKYGFIYARKEAKICEVIKLYYSRYDYFIFSRKINGVPYIFPLFCQKTSPIEFAKTRKYRLKDGWYYIDSFDKFIFHDEIKPEIIVTLLALHGKRISLFMNEEETINSLPILIKHSLTPQPTPQKPLKPIIDDKNNILYQFSFFIP